MIPDIIVNGGNITVRPIRDNNNIDVRMRNVRDIRVINTGVREIADNRIWLRQQPNAIPQNVALYFRNFTLQPKSTLQLKSQQPLHWQQQLQN